MIFNPPISYNFKSSKSKIAEMFLNISSYFSINVHFYAFDKPTALSAHGDTMVLPEQYSNVVTARTRYYVWQFKESPQQAAFALEDYKRGLKLMKLNLMEPNPSTVKDDRMRFI